MKEERVDIESVFKNIPVIKRKILDLTYRIDAMEVFISKVHQDMNTLETQLNEAEQDFPDKSGKSFKNLLKPIFSVRAYAMNFFSIHHQLSNYCALY